MQTDWRLEQRSRGDLRDVYSRDPCEDSLLDLAALLDDQLSDAGRARLATHLSDCAACQAVLRALVQDDQSRLTLVSLTR